MRVVRFDSFDTSDPVVDGNWTAGVGVAGLVTGAGVVRASPNLPDVNELDVAGGLSVRLGRRVTVDNDATCATVAEWRLGAGTGAGDLILVALGTGIGGGVVAGGSVRRGHNGFAGEFGHMIVDPSGPACVCGRAGCWERYASGAGLARMAREAVADGGGATMLELARGDADSLRGEHVEQAARAGDAEALALIEQFADWTAVGLANLTNAFDPEVIVIGGGLVGAADLFIDAVRRRFAESLYAPDHRPHPPVLIAELGEHAGAIGAALLSVGH